MSNVELARLMLVAMFETAKLTVYWMRGNTKRAKECEDRFKGWTAMLDKLESDGE